MSSSTSLFFCFLMRLPPISTLFPYTTLFRSELIPQPLAGVWELTASPVADPTFGGDSATGLAVSSQRSEEHTSELQSHSDLVCRLLLEKKKNTHSSETRGQISWLAQRSAADA